MDADGIPIPSDTDVLRLARDLAVQHEGAPADPQALAHAGPEALAARARARREAAARSGAADGARLCEVAGLQERFVAGHRDWIEDRLAAGRVRLVAAEPGAADGCDVAEALAQLWVELATRGQMDFAERLLAAYAREANDYPLYRMVDFYVRDAALARALRPDTPADVRQTLVGLARATSRRPLLPPVVVALGGWVASGKSTLAAALSERLAAPRIECDRLREFLEGAAPGSRATPAQRLAGFAPSFEDAAYELLRTDADAVLDSRRPVVLDGGLATRSRRREARALAQRHGLPFRFVECRTDSATLAARLAAREAAEGPGWTALARDYAGRWEPPDELPEEERVVVDGARPLPEMLAEVAARLPFWPERCPS